MNLILIYDVCYWTNQLMRLCESVDVPHQANAFNRNDMIRQNTCTQHRHQINEYIHFRADTGSLSIKTNTLNHVDEIHLLLHDIMHRVVIFMLTFTRIPEINILQNRSVFFFNLRFSYRDFSYISSMLIVRYPSSVWGCSAQPGKQAVKAHAKCFALQLW